MNKLKNIAHNAYILIKMLVLSIFETALIAVGIVLAGSVALIVLPVITWIGNAMFAKAKLRGVR